MIGAARDSRDGSAQRLGATENVSLTHVIADLERVKSFACRLLRVHALRSADALQLAAALDRRLGEAAEREGFEVPPAP